MTWSILFCLILLLGMVTLGLVHRRSALRALESTLSEREEARAAGSANAQLQYPAVDLSLCVGCGACVRACPEEGVLGLAHGQAVVIHGARCVGHGLCAEACPVDAVQVTLGDLSVRDDIPALTPELEAEGVPGLFLAGEVTGYALVRTAITHGKSVADQVAERRAARHGHHGGVHDLVVIGAGPAGLACGLAAKERGLDFVVLERDSVGGTVAKYPRRKLVMTRPVELPMYGRLKRSTYTKEELMETWESIARDFELPIRTGEEFTDLGQDGDGVFTVRTKTGEYRAHHVCFSVGRRGAPRKLGVPGEDSPKVVYGLVDAESYRERRILVVGGGDSAVEAAIALAEQPGNEVTVSYRKSAFFRIKAKNQRRLESARRSGTVEVRFETAVREIAPDHVRLAAADGSEFELPNDDVFVFAGGVPPFDMLRASGVSFDPTRRTASVETAEQGTGLIRALVGALLLSAATLLWCAAHYEYYGLPWAQRPDHGAHAWLAPTGWFGLSMGVAATVSILLNLAYLARRSRIGRWIAGSMRNWLSLHVVTGILALLLLLLHAGMLFRNTTGGLAFLSVLILVASGAIGRYFYAHLPKAANGRMLDQEEARATLATATSEWDRGGRGLGDGVRRELEALGGSAAWGGSLWDRIRGLFTAKSELRRRTAALVLAARDDGLAEAQIRELVGLARRVHKATMAAMHFEELRGLVASWRLIHRWLALAMVLLAANHIAVALRYGGLLR